VTGQNGIGQNGIGQNGTDKMVRTKWHGQNGSNFYRFQFNLIEFLFSNHKSPISDKPKWVYLEAGLMKKILLSMEAGLLDQLMILSVPFCTYHFVPYHFVLEPSNVTRNVAQ